MSDSTATANRLRDEARADLAGLRARHGALFDRSWHKRLRGPVLVLILLGLAAFAMVRLDFSLARIISGAGRLWDFALMMFPPSAGGHAATYIRTLGETLAIAYLGTMVAAIVALPIAFLAARNVIPNIFVHFATRRVFDTMRGVDTLIWALIWVGVVGLGPFAGVLAIACSDFGGFGKLFSEAIETADAKPVEGVASSGGSRLQQVRFGILPQIFPVIASQILYFFESNTRSATIIGIVGAGGIGTHLAEQIRVLEMQQVAFLVLLILITVTVIDFISARIRFAIIGQGAMSSRG